MPYWGIYTYTPPMFPGSHLLSFLLFSRIHCNYDPQSPALDTDIVGTVWMLCDELTESARARSPLVIESGSRCASVVNLILYR